MEIYQAKMATQQSLVYHHKLEHQRRRRLQAVEAVETLFSGAAPAFAFNVSGKPQAALANLENFLKNVRRHENIPADVPIQVLTIINWTAPSTISVPNLQVQETLLGASVNMEGTDTMGLVVMPVWDRKKGMLYKTDPDPGQDGICQCELR